MTAGHERIEELLAGYALLSLSGEDALEADRLLTGHVPSCPSCRQTASDLQVLAGELGLSVGAAAPPDLLLARIHRRMEDVPRAGRAPRRAAILTLAAGVVALAVMGGMSLSLGSRASRAEDQTTTALEILSVMRSPGATPVDLHPHGSTLQESGFVEVSAPEVRRIYLVSNACPDPAPGYAYQLWLGSEGAFVAFGQMFRPEDGRVLIELEVDVARYDEVWITEELAGSYPTEPRAGGRSWRAEL